MKVTINQLDEEISSKNGDLMIQQLKEKNSQLQKLINKYQVSSSADKISVCSQTCVSIIIIAVIFSHLAISKYVPHVCRLICTCTTSSKMCI